MKTLPHLRAGLWAALATLALTTSAASQTPSGLQATDVADDVAAYVAEIDAWHARRMERLRSDTGWLSLVGLHQLGPGAQTLGSDPEADMLLPPGAPPRVGVITVTDDGIRFTADEDVEVVVFESDPPERVDTTAMTVDVDGDPTVLACGPLLFYVIERGGVRSVRIKDRSNPAIKSVKDIERFPVDPKWRVEAELLPQVAPLALLYATGQTAESDSPGVLTFTVDGTAYQLRPVLEDDGSLFIVFGDETTGTDTYPGGRFLYTDAPDEAGMVVVDFNRAFTPPCAWTPYATCPTPPPENVLPVAVRAGEKHHQEH